MNKSEASTRKADAFLKLHHGPKILVLPNAWDAGSACVLADAGFPAVASTSSGVAVACGYPDGQRISRDEMLQAVARIVRAVDVPVTADLEAGYGPSPEDVAETVRRAIEIGAVGANIEDSTRSETGPALFDFSLSVERIRAGREAADAAGIPFVLNARTDAYLLGGGRIRNPFEESVRRANAYREAGAECLFVPLVSDGDEIGKLVEAIDGPLNVLAGEGSPAIRELESLGVARVSVGGSIAWACLERARQAARELLGPGTYSFATGAITGAELGKLLERRAVVRW